MADLTPRIKALVGRLASGRAEGATRSASGAPPTLRSGDASFGEAVARLVALPLDWYAREGAPLEIQVPWCHETLWLVPGDSDANSLGREGVSRGRVWRATELMALMAMPDPTLEIVETITRAKLAVDGDLVEVRPRLCDREAR